ncbi:uncharacterized protein S100141_01072 [Bacillus licheniformis]|uniref:hypothetical protein n=1 Tax=Bacillus licheniformis TaxID=1402 RepID=UPI000B56A586|nr:hypothetical protein [Bacillus licheniformis]ARW42394.1 uncharacterized protein S100141_01072 [Bacillus licheniformis]
MTNEEKKAVFIDLYELYQESELEEETMIWMKEHEQFFFRIRLKRQQPVIESSPACKKQMIIRSSFISRFLFTRYMVLSCSYRFG